MAARTDLFYVGTLPMRRQIDEYARFSENSGYVDPAVYVHIGFENRRENPTHHRTGNPDRRTILKGILYRVR